MVVKSNEPRFKLGDEIKCTCGAHDCPTGIITHVGKTLYQIKVKGVRRKIGIVFEHATLITKLHKVLL